MRSNSPVRRKTKCWVRLCSCFGAGDQTSPDATATRLPDAKENVYNTASALTTDDASPAEPSDDNAVLLQSQPTSTELPSAVAVAAQGDSSNHSSAPSQQQATTAVSSSIDQGDAVLEEAKQSEHVSHTQSAKTSSSNCDLWDKALKHLQESKEDKGIVAIVERFAKTPAADNATPKGLAKDIKEKMEQEINSKQHDSETRCFVEKTVSVLNKFLSIGDVAVSFDPIHAALPWAAVRFVLATITAGSELRSQQLAGLAKVTSLVLQCDMYQQLYMAPDPSLRPREDVLYTLETSIVYAYVKSLFFLGFVIQRQQSKSKWVDAPFKLGSMEEYVESLLDSGDRLAQAADSCEKQCNSLNRSTVKGLHDLAEELYKAFRDQAKLVLDIHQNMVPAKLHTAEGAAFDSLANQNDDKCHSGTRVALLEEIYKWADNPDGDCIFWLQGMAGTGKSTISRTIAHRLAEKYELGASFFFKRGQSDRGRAARFFTTIAAQLVHQLPSLAPHIQTAIKADSDIGEKAMKEQFDKLVLQPLEKVKCDLRNPWRTMVVVVDALDECDREEDATTIIGLLPQAKKLSSVRLKFFITSRPEFPILLQFDKISGTYQDLALHKVDEYTIEHDISVFFNSELLKIRDDYNRLAQKDWKLSLDWPGSTNLQILVKRAVPLFIFAKTVCRFVDDRGFGDPEEQLNKILEYQSTGKEFQLHATYLPVLTQMLMKRTDSGLVSRSAEEKAVIVKGFCEVVGTIVILAEPLPIGSLSKLLRISERTVGHRLSMLHSVLNIPSDSAIPVKLFHLSFRDFLVDPKNRETNPFWVDEEETHGRLATKCLNLLSEGNYLKKDICGLQMPGKRREEIKQKTILKCLPSEVQYACLYWIYHLKGSKRKVRDGDKVHQFLECYLLQWLEALSLIGRISESIGLIDGLQSLMDPATAVKISSFLYDAKRFILNCQLVIDLVPLQLYSSALVFAPEESVIRNTFQHFIPSWIALKPVMKRNWGPCIQTLEGHRGSVTSVAFSADSKLVVSGSGDRTIKIWDAATGREMQTLAIGTTLHSISFGITGAYLNTDIGVAALDTLLAIDTAPSAPTQGCGLSSDGIWTTWDSENLLWLPTEYRPLRSAVSASTVAIGCASGRVLIFGFSVEETRVV